MTIKYLPEALPSSDHLPPLDSPFPGLFSVRRACQIFRAKEERELRGRLGDRVTIKESRN